MTEPHTHISADPVQRRIWRVKVHAKELLDCGFYPEMIAPWECLKKILHAKKLPDWCMSERTPARIEMAEDGILLEFDG